MEKYKKLLRKIINNGKEQHNKKGTIIYLLNETLSFNLNDILKFLNKTPLARKKLREELKLYMEGRTNITSYHKKGIYWWDYCAPKLINSYPTYFKKLPSLIEKINNELSSSKNYILFLGATGVKTNQLPCISLIQFQINSTGLNITVYQRSADCNLGLPSDIYQIYLISNLILCNLNSITFFIGNAHIYQNNLQSTKLYLCNKKVKFNLNV